MRTGFDSLLSANKLCASAGYVGNNPGPCQAAGLRMRLRSERRGRSTSVLTGVVEAVVSAFHAPQQGRGHVRTQVVNCVCVALQRVDFDS